MNLLDEGFVKEISVSSGSDKTIIYDMIKKDGKEITLIRYDQDLNIVRKDVMVIKPDKWLLKKQELLNSKKELMAVDIIEPDVLSFNPQDTQLTSEVTYSPGENISVSIKTDAQMVGKEKVEFRNRKVACIKYIVETDIKIEDIGNQSVLQQNHLSGKTYFGDGIGFISMKNMENGKEVNYKVESILSIEEFERKL